MTAAAHTPVLMLSSIYPAHNERSGYGRQLAEHVPGAEFLSTERGEPRSGLPLFFSRAARRFAFTRWYLGGNAVLEWKAVRRLWKGFDGVVHSMWADHDLGYIDLFLDKRRHKFCGTFHNCSDDFRHTIRYRSRLRNFDAVILVSETQRTFFLEAGVPDEKIHVVLLGVDAEYFVPAQVQKPSPLFTVISVGGYRRNFPLLRKVCERLANTRNIRFKIIAPESRRLLFSDLSNVEFHSGLNDAEVLAAYQSASCLLHTAENATANTALLEAMACGLPVVAERVGGIPEYVSAEFALLVEPGEDATLAGAIRELAQSPALHAGMRIEARKHAETLAWPQVAGRMIKIYQSL